MNSTLNLRYYDIEVRCDYRGECIAYAGFGLHFGSSRDTFYCVGYSGFLNSDECTTDWDDSTFRPSMICCQLRCEFEGDDAELLPPTRFTIHIIVVNGLPPTFVVAEIRGDGTNYNLRITPRPVNAVSVGEPVNFK